jgi:hypothetical protein
MSEEKKETNLVVAGLKFSGSEMAEASRDEKNTQLAIGLLAFSVLFATVLAFFYGNAGNSGFGRDGYMGWQAAIAEFGSSMLGTFLSAYVMTFTIRAFKVKLAYPETLRLYGAAIIWTILGTVFSLILNLGVDLGIVGMIAGIGLWLAYNFALMFGVAAYTKIKLWKAFLTIILTFVIVFIAIILYGVIFGAIF